MEHFRLEQHDKLDEVYRIRTQVIRQGRLKRNLFRLDSQLADEDLTHKSKNLLVTATCMGLHGFRRPTPFPLWPFTRFARRYLPIVFTVF